MAAQPWSTGAVFKSYTAATYRQLLIKQTLDSFSHFTYHMSGQQLVMVDFEGEFTGLLIAYGID